MSDRLDAELDERRNRIESVAAERRRVYGFGVGDRVAFHLRSITVSAVVSEIWYSSDGPPQVIHLASGQTIPWHAIDRYEKES